MTATKKHSDANHITWREWLSRSTQSLLRWSIAATLTALAIGSVFYGLWRHVQTHVMASRDFVFDPRSIVILPAKPDWIHVDVRAEVVRNASIDDQQTILDDELASRLYKAIALHPWVARVERVVKRQPAAIEVEVAYRRPVCMVEVPGGLFAVDAEGVLLPTADFLNSDVTQYPRLSGLIVATEGPVGTRWLDLHVQEAARLAEVLIDDWSQLKLARIVLAPNEGTLPPDVGGEYDLFTHAGTRVRWGCAPPHARPAEPSAADKLAWLRSFAAQAGSLDGALGPQELDLRRGPSIVVAPLAAGAH